jgi:hypothetical protein
MPDIARCRPRTDLGWFLRPLDDLGDAEHFWEPHRTAGRCARVSTGTVHEPKGVTRDKHGEEGTGDRHQRNVRRRAEPVRAFAQRLAAPPWLREWIARLCGPSRSELVQERTDEEAAERKGPPWERVAAQQEHAR